MHGVEVPYFTQQSNIKWVEMQQFYQTMTMATVDIFYLSLPALLPLDQFLLNVLLRHKLKTEKKEVNNKLKQRCNRTLLQ